MKWTWVIAGIVLLVTGCVNRSKSQVPALTVAIPSVVQPVNGSFVLVPTITLKNTAGVPLRMVFVGSEPENVTFEFDVFDAKGRKLAVLDSKSLYFLGGGRVRSESLPPGASWTWKSHYADRYPVSPDPKEPEMGAYRIIARVHLNSSARDLQGVEYQNPPNLATAALNALIADPRVGGGTQYNFESSPFKFVMK